jgi:glucose/arabinose dehydrogenase
MPVLRIPSTAVTATVRIVSIHKAALTQIQFVFGDKVTRLANFDNLPVNGHAAWQCIPADLRPKPKGCRVFVRTLTFKRRMYVPYPMTAVAALILVKTMTGAIAADFTIEGTAGTTLEAEVLNEFNEPWAMTFLPDGKMLVTEKSGALLLVSPSGKMKTEIINLPEVAYGGQGGLGDVIIHPDFDKNQLVYLSYVEAGSSNTSGAAVVRAKLELKTLSPKLEEIKVIWRQIPKVTGNGHFSHRLAFAPDGKLFITSGDRQKMEPAQDMGSGLGKIIRLNDDGSMPPDNPFQDDGNLARQFWSMGHRNLLGIAFDAAGNLWQSEMGPRHGDELNVVIKGSNYGWPVVSEGRHYSGFPIPPHKEYPQYQAPKVAWSPSIAPSGLIIYKGSLFPGWQGDAFLGGLVSQALIRVDIEGLSAMEAERFSWDRRIREVEEGPDGAIYVLEDQAGGRLIRLTPQQ